MSWLKNPFSEKTRELFDRWWWMESHESWRNWANCLHHILWRVSNSPYNACPLNNQYEHQPEWRKWLSPLSSQEVRSKYLIKTKNYLDSIWYKPNKKDIEFLEKYKQYYEWWAI